MMETMTANYMKPSVLTLEGDDRMPPEWKSNEAMKAMLLGKAV